MSENKKQIGLFKRIIRYFLAGLFTILPAVITIVAIAWTIDFLAGVVGPETEVGEFLSRIGLRFVTDSKFAYVVGWIGLGLVILFVGILVESGMRGFINRLTKAIVRRIPLIGKVYDTSEQLVSMIDSGGDDKLKGMSVVYCQFGEQKGVGVLALLPTSETVRIRGCDHNVVMIPQSPIPIGGALLFIPVDQVERVEMPVDTLMSIYVSMGVIAPNKMGESDTVSPTVS